MKILTKKTRDRLWVFVTSALIAAVLLATYQSIIYAAKLDTEDRQLERIHNIRTAEWNTVDVVIKDTIDKAGKKLDNEIIPSILSDIKTSYGTDTEKLKYDLQNFSDKSYDNPLIHILAKNIDKKYMYDIKSDSNDIFILTKKDGIISDLSVSTSSPDRPRSLNLEAATHYNKELANKAFSEIINQSKRVNTPPIFWQFFRPINTNEKKLIDMSFPELKASFENEGGGLSMLESYEFLVPRYIFFDYDLLGNPLVNDRGVRQDIYQIILVQGFNATEVIEQTGLLDSIYKGISVEHQYSFIEFASMSKTLQVLLFIGTFTIVAWIQFSVRIRRKYVDDDLGPL